MKKTHLKRVATLSPGQLGTFLAIFASVGAFALYLSTQAAGTVCNLNATPANFAAQVSAATAGQTVCLATGNYGSWTGTNKAITIAAATGATPTMGFEFRPEDSAFTLDGITLTGGAFLNYGDGNGPKNITIRNSAFTGSVMFDGPLDSNILLDHNTHININFAGPLSGVTCSDTPAAIHFPYNSTRTSGVTIQNSLFKGGNKDGIQTGIGVNIIGNEFDDIGEHGALCAEYNDSPHTDSIQILGAKGTVVRGNYLHNVVTGIVAYDGIDSALIEDNVVATTNRPDGIELLSDKNSIVRHNVVVYKSGCGNGSNECGGVWLGHKSADPAGSGTVLENNIATYFSINDGSTTAVNAKNMLRSGASGTNFVGVPVFAGGAAPTTYAGYALAAGSPGKSAGSDGLDVGIRLSAQPTASPTPTWSPTVTPTATPTSGQISLGTLNGSTVSGYKVIGAFGSVDVSGITIKVNGAAVPASTGCGQLPTPLPNVTSVCWDTRGVANGTATVTATGNISGGGTAQATATVTVANSVSNPSDLNADGAVNVFDLSILLSRWSMSGAGDIDGNGTVNVFDLSRLLGNWGAG